MCAYIKLTLPELTIDFNNFLLLFFLSSLKPPPSLQISLLLPHAQSLSRSHSICLALSRSLSAIQRRSCSLSLLRLCAEYERKHSMQVGLSRIRRNSSNRCDECQCLIGNCSFGVDAQRNRQGRHNAQWSKALLNCMIRNMTNKILYCLVSYLYHLILLNMRLKIN